MSYNFVMNDLDEFMSLSQKNKELEIILPNNFGEMNCKKEYINNDIYIFKTNTKINKNCSIQANLKLDTLFINIILDGKVKYKQSPLETIETFNKNDINIKYFKEYETKTILEKDNYSRGLAISIKKEFIEKNLSSQFCLLEKLESSHRVKVPSLIHKQDTKRNIKLANEIFYSSFKGELQDIYIQSKVFELIYNEFNEVNRYFCNDKYEYEKVKLTKDDIEALNKAKDIINSTYEFPDLNTLSKKVAINEFKLKFGFKKLFNTTVGQMVLEKKMNYAKKLLETTEYSVSEVAFYVGYKYQQSFSNAFFQFFGIRPKDVMKRRNYYY